MEVESILEHSAKLLTKFSVFLKVAVLHMFYCTALVYDEAMQ